MSGADLSPTTPSARAAAPGDDERLARVAWSSIAEPGDVIAGALVGSMGARAALDWLRDSVKAGAEAVADARLSRAVSRWAARLAESAPERDLAALERIKGRLVVPGDRAWPARVDDLGPQAPLCLWVRGAADLAASTARAVSLVGARAATTYGERVAYDLAAGLASRGVCVVSGGAYGVDAAAHRGALAGGGPTVVVLAGGVDRTYPSGNARLFDAALEAGAIVSELAPGRLPTKSRFLLRNRVIAALTPATVVVEAAWRSGALSTAHHAARLLRPVGAVPGPVTSVASAGCHRLLRDGVAVCVTDVDEVLELAGPSDAGLVPIRPADDRADDCADPVARLVRDALPRRGAHSVPRLASSAGLAADEVRAALGLLELAGIAERRGDGWGLADRRG